MRNVSPRAPDVNSAAPARRRRSRTLRPATVTLLSTLILVVSTACGTADHQSTSGGSAFLVLAIGALIVAILLLGTVGRLMGQIFELAMNLLKVIATIGFTAAVVIAAVILAVMAATAS